MFSFAVTAYEETMPRRMHGQRILRCLKPAIEHPAIDEIVVVDDGSQDFSQLEALLGKAPKLHLYHNEENLGVFGNKVEAIARCTSDWVVTCDSDNHLPKDFIDLLANIKLSENVWYCPSFARPHFDYRELAGVYDLSTIHELQGLPLAECCMNTGNQTVHRESFIEAFAHLRGPRFDLKMECPMGVPTSRRNGETWRLAWNACDSLILNATWLRFGGRMYVMEGLEYDHFRATKDEGNYVRSPREKRLLGEKLISNLWEESRSVEPCQE